MRKLLLTIALAALSSGVWAGSVYTKGQLNNMVSRGEYPAQGPVTNTQTRQLSFPDCKVTVESVMSALRGEYPVRTVVDTSIIYMVKAWTNDGAVIATCSKPDRKLVLTQASYL